MRTDSRLINLVALLSILTASTVVYELSGKAALVVTDATAAGLYRLWRGHAPGEEGSEYGSEYGSKDDSENGSAVSAALSVSAMGEGLKGRAKIS